MTDDDVPISSGHYAKDPRGRWVLLFGRHRGKRLRQVPTSYLGWMLREVEFVRGPFRRAALAEARRREVDDACDVDHEDGCCCWECRQQELFDDCFDGTEWGDQ